jgi:hypothetical protein
MAHGDGTKCLSSLFILERVQKRHGTVEIRRHRCCAGSRKPNRTDLFFSELVLVTLVGEQGTYQEDYRQQFERHAHGILLMGEQNVPPILT